MDVVADADQDGARARFRDRNAAENRPVTVAGTCSGRMVVFRFAALTDSEPFTVEWKRRVRPWDAGRSRR